jgi:hypothetical protein
MFRPLLYFSLLFIVLSVSFCRSDVYRPNACYNQTVKPIILNNCTRSGCHNAQSRVAQLDLSTYNGLMKIVKPKHPLQSSLYKAISGRGEDQMPPDHRLSKEEINNIKSWIAFGAAENDCPTQACDSADVKYSVQITKILSDNCNGCHSAGTIILTNYNLVQVLAANGKLLGSVKQTGNYLAMPQGGRLSDCEIAIIEKWVNAGAPNN